MLMHGNIITSLKIIENELRDLGPEAYFFVLFIYSVAIYHCNMIHISKLNIITEKKDGSGEPVPFDFKAVTLQGEILEGLQVIVTSSNFQRRTRNIKFPESGEFRKLRNISFIEVNGEEITM